MAAAQQRLTAVAQEQAQVSVQRPARQSPSLPARPRLSQAAALLREQQTLLEVARPGVALSAAQEPLPWAVALPAPSLAAAARATLALQSLSATEWPPVQTHVQVQVQARVSRRAAPAVATPAWP